jgi:hypothetical protein
MTGSRQNGKIHWIKGDGTKTVEESEQTPTFHKMKDFLGDHPEHVSVLYEGKLTSMFVHEFGRIVFDERNPTATDIYFALSRAQGFDPESLTSEMETDAARQWADHLGVPPENVINLDPAPEKPPGIYGPAILLEGFKRT